jgi:hypothetical protein
VRLDPRASGEGELGHRAALVAVDDPPGDARGPGRAVRPAVTDPEPENLDRHRAAIRQRRRRLRRAAFGRIVDSGRAYFVRVK